MEAKERVTIPSDEEAVLALVSLGYNKLDARKAVQKVNSESEGSLPVEEMIKKALKYAG